MIRSVNIIKPSIKEIEALVSLSEPYMKDGWEFSDWGYKSLKDVIYVEQTPINDLVETLNERLEIDGYFIVDFRYLLDDFAENIVATVSTFVLSLIGEPIKIFNNISSLWRKVGVNLDKHPNKSEGVGKSPLHMDFVNAENPPELVCLFAIRCDEQMGGYSIVSDYQNAEKNLPILLKRELLKKQFVDGQVVNLLNIGNDINPFAIISEDEPWKYRITGNLLNSLVETNASLAVKALFEELEKRKLSFLLEKGYYLVVNQRKMLHGKEALGNDQVTIPENKRRLLMHAFARK